MFIFTDLEQTATTFHGNVTQFYQFVFVWCMTKHPKATKLNLKTYKSYIGKWKSWAGNSTMWLNGSQEKKKSVKPRFSISAAMLWYPTLLEVKDLWTPFWKEVSKVMSFEKYCRKWVIFFFKFFPHSLKWPNNLESSVDDQVIL